MGLVIPQISPFIYSYLEIQQPGIIFFTAQMTLPAGALLSGYLSDKTLHVRYIAFPLTLFGSAGLWALSQLTPGSEHKVLHATAGWSAFMFALGGIIPLINISYLQNGLNDRFFGRIRLYGTLGFTLPNGWLMMSYFSPKEAIYFGALATLASAGFLFLLPLGRAIPEKGLSPITLKKVHQLLTSSLFIFFLVLMFLFFFNFSVAEYVVSEYVRPTKFVVDPVAFIWFLGTMVEVGFFVVSPGILHKQGPLGLISWGFGASFLRYLLLFTLAPGTALLFAQGLHGIQFSGSHLGALIYLKDKTSPERLATAQALMTTFSKATGAGIGAFLLGNIAGNKEFSSVFLIASLTSACGIILLLLFMRFQKKYTHFIKDSEAPS